MEHSINASKMQRFISYDLSLGFIWSTFHCKQGPEYHLFSTVTLRTDTELAALLISKHTMPFSLFQEIPSS